MFRLLRGVLLIGGLLLILATMLLNNARQEAPRQEWLLFDSNRDTAPGVRNLYRVHLSGRGLVQLTDNQVSDRFVSWTPDGNHLIMMSSDAGYPVSLHRLNLRTFRPEKLSPRRYEDVFGASPDNRWLAYGVLDTDTGFYRLYVIAADGGEPRLLADRVQARFPEPHQTVRWSPDSHWIYFVRLDAARNQNIYRVPHEGGPVQQLTALENTALNGNAAMPLFFDWSPDGRWLWFTAEHDNHQGELYRLHAESGRVERLTDNPGVDDFESNVGQWIVYSSAPPGEWRRNLYSMTVDGSAPRQLSATDGLDTYLTHSPDGQWIYLATTFGGDRSMFSRVRMDGSIQQQIPFERGFPEFLGWSADGWLYMEAFRFDGTSELYRMLPDGTQQQLIIDRVASDRPIVFSPEGRWLVMSRYHDSQPGDAAFLYGVNLHSREIINITAPPNSGPTFMSRDSFVAWLPVIDLTWQPGLLLAMGAGVLLAGLLISGKAGGIGRKGLPAAVVQDAEPG